MNLAELRQNYTLQSLSETDVLPDPLAQFARWFDEARQGLLREPNAMTLATATPDGRPSARTVLLKSFDAEGFTFFTNYASRKGEELAANPVGALLFTWLELERQIRIEGLVEKISREESLAYFQSRPRESQIGAWASPQSQPVSRAEMETRQQALEAEYAGVETLPMPPSWGGYRLRPNWFEFWQGRPSRLHDRIVYQRKAEGGWEIGRLGA